MVLEIARPKPRHHRRRKPAYHWLRRLNNIYSDPGIGVVNRVTNTVDVVNTAVDTSIFSYVVPGNLLALNRSLRVTLLCDYIANSGTPTLTMKLLYGATTLWNSNASAVLGANAARGGIFIQFILQNKGATNSQQAMGTMILPSRTIAATTGVGGINSTTYNASFYGTSAEDSTLAKTLDFHVQWSAANATYSFRCYGAIVELL